LCPLRRDNLFQDRVQSFRDLPFRIVAPKFPEIRDVANVIALARFLDVAPIQLPPGHLFNPPDGFQYGDAVFAAPTQIVNLAGPWTGGKLLDRAHYVVAVNIVAHLLALITKDRVRAPCQRDLYQVRQIAMQLHAGMRRPGQAPSSKDTDLHIEIPSILLRDKISRRFRSPKRRMQCPVDPARFVHAGKIFRPRVVIALFEFLQRDLIRRVAIHFVGAEKHEDRFRTVLPGGFEKVHGTQRIDFKIQQWNFARLVVRWLRRAMHDEVKSVRSKQLLYAGPVANIERRMLKPFGRRFQPLQVPKRVAGRAKKNAPHVIVHADNFVPLAVEVFGRFRANQSAATGNKDFHPFDAAPIPVARSTQKTPCTRREQQSSLGWSMGREEWLPPLAG